MTYLTVEMVKRGLSHSAIAHSLGLDLTALRQYFAPELTKAALHAEILNPAVNRRPSCSRPASAKPPKDQPLKEEETVGFVVYNNDGEPNYPY